MPDYLYRCSNCGNEERVRHRMSADFAVMCNCRNQMHRVPQQIGGVNWGQLRPSQGDYPRVYDKLMATKAEREERFYQRKNTHVNTEPESKAKTND